MKYAIGIGIAAALVAIFGFVMFSTKVDDVQVTSHHWRIEQQIDGDTFLTARLVEMPHCIVQGNGLAELCSEMESAAYEYILTGLQYGATIPDPYPYTVPTYA